VDACRSNPGTLAECLLEWFPPPPDADSDSVQAAALRVAQTIDLVARSLTAKK
jgi:hypothetical protein